MKFNTLILCLLLSTSLFSQADYKSSNTQFVLEDYFINYDSDWRRYKWDVGVEEVVVLSCDNDPCERTSTKTLPDGTEIEITTELEIRSEAIVVTKESNPLTGEINNVNKIIVKKPDIEWESNISKEGYSIYNSYMSEITTPSGYYGDCLTVKEQFKSKIPELQEIYGSYYTVYYYARNRGLVATRMYDSKTQTLLSDENATTNKNLIDDKYAYYNQGIEGENFEETTLTKEQILKENEKYQEAEAVAMNTTQEKARKIIATQKKAREIEKTESNISSQAVEIHCEGETIVRIDKAQKPESQFNPSTVNIFTINEDEDLITVISAIRFEGKYETIYSILNKHQSQNSLIYKCKDKNHPNQDFAIKVENSSVTLVTGTDQYPTLTYTSKIVSSRQIKP